MSRFLLALLAVCAALLLSTARAADARPVVEIYMPSPCLAFIDWGTYLAERRFRVVCKETAAMAEVERRLKVPAAVGSVQIAVVGGYFVEGHAYAEVIQELRRDQPNARGIVVPGLPRGAPGRELSNPTCETACPVEVGLAGRRVVLLPDGLLDDAIATESIAGFDARQFLRFRAVDDVATALRQRSLGGRAAGTGGDLRRRDAAEGGCQLAGLRVLADQR